ncbi:MAG: TetR/AcrR family transcriptional regulator [Chloroflexaceae bacterium]|jgi:AcrR family transcriptional regulator|nr:TetR/AcrR family transcriptional regulator [Chloroflexaceae bacterium]
MTTIDERTRNTTAIKIVDAAAHLFMQRGYRAVSINDIVSAAEVTKPTLYYYFPDKEALFVQMCLRLLERMHERMVDAMSRNTGFENRLVALARVVIGVQEGDMRMMRQEMQEHLAPEQQRKLGQAFYNHLFQPVQRVLQQGIDEGTITDYNAQQLTWLFLGMSETFHWENNRPTSMAAHAYREEQGKSALFSPEAMVRFFLHGVATKTQE